MNHEIRSSSGFSIPQSYDRPETSGGKPPPPGRFPYTRGFREDGYRDHFWSWEMYAGFGGADEASKRYQLLLENGATGGISIALDLPTQLGYDSDDEMSQGEVGRAGVSLDSYADIDRLFTGIRLDEVGHVFSTANCIGPVMYAWMLVYCRRHSIDPNSFALQIQNDPIKEYVARGTQFLPIEPAVRLATDVIAYSHEHTPRWLPISVSGSHMKQAGASPALEAAFTIANAMAYLESVEQKGVVIADFHPSFELHFCTDMDFFEEVAKYRAVRRAWSKIVSARFAVPDDGRLHFRLHAATSGLPLTAQQPMNNIARITLQVLAQVLGGCEATRTASWDEALAIPTEDAAILSLRINQIIAHESGVARTTDPLGGSYYVEALTDRIYQVIRDQLEAIEALGGAIQAVHSGYYDDAIGRQAYEDQRAFDTGDRIVVGVNKYRADDEVVYPRFKADPTSERRQQDAVVQRRAARDDRRVREALMHLRGVCAGEGNVMPSVIEAVETEATVGEICTVWREVFGEFRAKTERF